MKTFLSGAITFIFVSAVFIASARADGRKIFESNRCGLCHELKASLDLTVEGQLKKRGPELWYAGSKFQRPFLQEWLKDPKPIRPMEHNSLTKKNQGKHPRLGYKDASEVAEFLMKLKSPEVRNSGIKAEAGDTGASIFERKQGCYGCHQFRSGNKVFGGVTGPSLVGAGARLSPDWIYAFLSDPKAFRPVSSMPVYAGYLSDPEMRALAGYISGFE